MRHQLRLFTETLPTPIGTLVVIPDDNDDLRAIDWLDYDDRMRRLLARHYGADGVILTPAAESSRHVSALAALLRRESPCHRLLMTANRRYRVSETSLGRATRDPRGTDGELCRPGETHRPADRGAR